MGSMRGAAQTPAGAGAAQQGGRRTAGAPGQGQRTQRRDLALLAGRQLLPLLLLGAQRLQLGAQHLGGGLVLGGAVAPARGLLLRRGALQLRGRAGGRV